MSNDVIIIKCDRLAQPSLLLILYKPSTRMNSDSLKGHILPNESLLLNFTLLSISIILLKTGTLFWESLCF